MNSRRRTCGILARARLSTSPYLELQNTVGRPAVHANAENCLSELLLWGGCKQGCCRDDAGLPCDGPSGARPRPTVPCQHRRAPRCGCGACRRGRRAAAPDPGARAANGAGASPAGCVRPRRPATRRLGVTVSAPASLSVPPSPPLSPTPPPLAPLAGLRETLSCPLPLPLLLSRCMLGAAIAARARCCCHPPLRCCVPTLRSIACARCHVPCC